MTDDLAAILVRRFEAAGMRRAAWESHWRECFEHTIPQRGGTLGGMTPGAKQGGRLFDGTAPDAVEQLAASLLAELTPPWGRWFTFSPGVALPDGSEARDSLSQALEQTAETILGHFDRSNFAVEVHQCYLDLVTAGTACLLFEEAPPGEPSAFRFTAVPLDEVVVEDGGRGRLDATFRKSVLTASALRVRFPSSPLPDIPAEAADGGEGRAEVLEAVVPDAHAYTYTALLLNGTDGDAPQVLARGRFADQPFITFRWLKAPGELYGRSPVMKALPDIKTANKVVELVLKNATIAVTGIWQADDDGVLNPANIKLIPGTIIPKAVGSAGLTPLEAPGRFDVSQLVLDSLRARIRHALLADRLGQQGGPHMTATEVLERSAEMARLLGATYGRLQSELLTPLVLRAVSVLSRRGEITPVSIDGHRVRLRFTAPLAQGQAQRDAHGTIGWLNAVAAMGPEAMQAVDLPKAARWLAEALGVPAEILRPEEPAEILRPEETVGPALGEDPP